MQKVVHTSMNKGMMPFVLKKGVDVPFPQEAVDRSSSSRYLFCSGLHILIFFTPLNTFLLFCQDSCLGVELNLHWSLLLTTFVEDRRNEIILFTLDFLTAFDN